MNQAQLIKQIKQTDAIFALEGFEKSEVVRSTDAAVLAGLGTYEEAHAELLTYVRKHRTMRGFAYSKTVGLLQTA